MAGEGREGIQGMTDMSSGDGPLKRAELAAILSRILNSYSLALLGMYKKGEYDLAGFSVGAVKRSEILPQGIVAGDLLIGAYRCTCVLFNCWLQEVQ